MLVTTDLNIKIYNENPNPKAIDKVVKVLENVGLVGCYSENTPSEKYQNITSFYFSK